VCSPLGFVSLGMCETDIDNNAGAEVFVQELPPDEIAYTDSVENYDTIVVQYGADVYTCKINNGVSTVINVRY